MAIDDLMRDRVNMYSMYYRIAHENTRVYFDSDQELKELETKGIAEEELNVVAERMEQCYSSREQSAVIAITFAAMALEAFLYDYAAEKLGDTYVKEHLDKLDVRSKFLVYPELVCGKRPDKSHRAYQLVGQLVKLRNDLVHFKSRSVPIGDLHKKSNFHDELNDRLRFGVTEAAHSVSAAVAEIDQLHGGSAFTRTLKAALV